MRDVPNEENGVAEAGVSRTHQRQVQTCLSPVLKTGSITGSYSLPIGANFESDHRLYTETEVVLGNNIPAIEQQFADPPFLVNCFSPRPGA
jgi:hypothetical protein